MEENQQPNALDHFLRLRAAFAAGQADHLGPGDTIPATMLEIGCLLQLLDRTAITANACEAAGAKDGWDAAVKHTAKVVGPTANTYLTAMLAANPYKQQAELLMELASTPEGHHNDR